MEEIKDLIKQEDYEKYKKLLQEFECKAIDIIEDLTYQFKETLAEEIDDKIKGWKKDNERILRENWEKDDKIKQLEQELAELKEKDNYHLRYELAGADETITNLKKQLEEKDQQIKKRVMVYEKQFIVQTNEIYSLKQQLAEKQNTIDEINKEFVQAVHDWKTLCAEKDKEIEDWKQKTQTFLNRVNEQNYEIANNNPKQLAIQELEKARMQLRQDIFITAQESELKKLKDYLISVDDFIDNQIKVLKGE